MTKVEPVISYQPVRLSKNKKSRLPILKSGIFNPAEAVIKECFS
jgi:hypothetical protein